MEIKSIRFDSMGVNFNYKNIDTVYWLWPWKRFKCYSAPWVSVEYMSRFKSLKGLNEMHQEQVQMSMMCG